jgi:hypothetical protein
MRWRWPIVLTSALAALALSAARAEPPQPNPENNQQVKGYHRNVKKMGGGISRRLVGSGRIGGNKKSISKTKYAYSERSFSSRQAEGDSLLQEKHAAAFAGAGSEACPDAADTNAPPANAEGAVPPPPPNP